MDDTFRILLQAALDKITSKKNIDADVSDLQNQIDKIKIKAELDKNTAQKLKKDIEDLINQQITLSNINIDKQKIRQTAQQTANILSKETEHALAGVSSNGINVEFHVSKKASNEFRDAVDKEIAEIQKRDNTVVSVKMTTDTKQVPVLDVNGVATGDYDYVERLTGAVFKYNTALGETITKTMKWAEIGTQTNSKGEEIPLMGWVQGATTYNKTIEDAAQKTDSFVDKQKKLAASLENNAEKLKRLAIDPESQTSIKKAENVDAVNTQYDKIEAALATLRTASVDTFTDAEIAVRKEILELELLISTLKNAETAATTLRKKPIEVIKDEMLRKVEGLEADMKKAGVQSQELGDQIGIVKTALSGDVDFPAVDEAMNAYARASAELGKLKKEAAATATKAKLDLDIEGLRKTIIATKDANTNLSQFEATVGSAALSIDDFENKLSGIKNAGDLSVVKKEWQQYLTAAIEAGEVTDKTIYDIALRYRELQAEATKAGASSIILRDNLASAGEILFKPNVDSSDIVRAIEYLDIAQGELSALKKENAADSSQAKLNVDIAGLERIINNTAKANENLSEFTIAIGDAELSLGYFDTRLGNIANADDFAVVKKEWQEYASAAIDAGQITDKTIYDVALGYRDLQAEISKTGVSSVVLNDNLKSIGEILAKPSVDSSDIVQAIEYLDIAQDELRVLKKEATVVAANAKIKVKVDTEIAKLDNLAEQNSAFKGFKTVIDGTTYSVNELKAALKAATTETDYQLAIARTEAFKDIFKSTGKTVEELSTEMSTKMRELKADIDKTGVSSANLDKYLKDIESTLGNPDVDASGINDALLIYQKAVAEFSVLKKEASSAASLEKAKIKASGLSDTINAIAKANTQLLQYEATIGETKVSIQYLLDELAKVKTTGDVSHLEGIWKSYIAKALEAGQITSKSLLSEKQLIRFQTEKARILQRVSTYLAENTKLTKDSSVAAKELVQRINAIKSSVESLDDGDTFKLGTLNKELNIAISNVKELGLEGRSLVEEAKNMFTKFSGWFSVSQAVMLFVSKIKEATAEIKELDTTLTEISKTSDLAGEELQELGDRAFETASKYGKAANAYLLGVQEMSRAGYENMEQMAELSTLVQSAGDLTAELANDYIIAADAAYDYKGDVEKLTALLDAQNQVTNRNAVSMEELANATRTAGSLLANVANLSEQEMTAILGAGIASSRESGETVARAVRSIMMNLQGVAGEGGFDGEVIDEEALAKVEARCHSLGVELEYVKDGAVKLRDPMEILKDLADVYNRLDEDDPARAALISDIGGKYRANILANLLEQWSTVEKIMEDYEDASGSMAREAEKSANSLEGSLNRLSNTWTDTVSNIADPDMLANAVNMFNDLLTGVNNLTDSLGTLGTVGLAAGVYLGAKNDGRHKMFCLLNMPSATCVL